jgi:hypothetical protein
MFATHTNVTTFMGVERYSKWIGTLERFLQLEQWVKDVDKEVGHTRHDLDQIQKYIPPLVERLKMTLERRDGLGTKLIKVHLLLHLVEMHRNYGRLENCNTASGETRHKHFVKNAGKQTQRRKGTFDREIAKRNAETVVINSGHHGRSSPGDPSTTNKRRIGTEGYLYLVDQKGIKKHPKSNCYVHIDDPSLPEAVRSALNHVFTELKADPSKKAYAVVYHTYSDTHCTYRACPRYLSEPWYDWALLNTSIDRVDTVRALCFVQFFHTSPTFMLFGGNAINGVSYLLHQKLEGEATRIETHPESTMLSSAKMLPGIFCALTTQISGPALVYQDVEFIDRRHLSGIRHTEYFGIICPRTEWTQLFVTRATEDERL